MTTMMLMIKAGDTRLGIRDWAANLSSPIATPYYPQIDKTRSFGGDPWG